MTDDGLAAIREAFDLGHYYVAMIKRGSQTQEDRETVRDALLNGVVQHAIVRAIVAGADYSQD